MRVQSLVSALAVASAVVAEDAPVIKNNPVGAEYQVELKSRAPWEVTGTVKIATGASGEGVTVKVDLAGLPAEHGPFMYHIHEKPVPADGNCTGTGAHLDPYKRGEVPICDSKVPQTCQTGDLSGKHGNITERTWNKIYDDVYLATLLSDPSFFGDKSVVVHLSNKTRIACGNFTQLSSPPLPSGTATPSAVPGGSTNSSGSPSYAAPGTPAPSAPISFQGAGAKLVASSAALFAFAAILML